MSDTSQGPGWWLASDGKWYPPELWTGPPAQRPSGAPAGTTPTVQPQGSAAYPSVTPGYVNRDYGNPGYGNPGYGNTGFQYPAQGVGAPYGQGLGQKTNGLAIASLVCSIAGLFFLTAIAGVTFGFIARSQITRANGLQKGRGLALAGIIVGCGWLALVVLGVALGGGSSSTTGNSGMVNPGILLGLGFGGPFI